ncbi:MAG: coenzyme F420-0:L-glutamate ligase [Candidatus Bathyarchaeota archaeon]|nr:coenzyme F420-0:L-glutamate ligase [Candidatus Bathyarchaeota archaeon]
MVKYKSIQSLYWSPGTKFCKIIADLIQPVIRDGDIIIVSEKAVAIAKSRLVNEEKLIPSVSARFLAAIWSRFIWGLFLGYLCRFKPLTIQRLKNYPRIKGSHHKQTVLMYRGLIPALHYGSEGGIDLNNVPYAFACIPLENPLNDAKAILNHIQAVSNKQLTLIISDTDSTFSWKNIHFTSRSQAIKGIIPLNNPLGFIIGRFARLKQRATPLAAVGQKISVDNALRFSEIAHRARGQGAGRTVWDSAKEFGVGPSDITWELLASIKHYPIVIIRRTRQKHASEKV